MSSYLEDQPVEETKLREFIIDILHYDIESVQTLISHLNLSIPIGWRRFWPHNFTEQEVLPALKDLIRENLVQVLQLSEVTRQLEAVDGDPMISLNDPNSLWFNLTHEGYLKWREWIPPQE